MRTLYLDVATTGIDLLKDRVVEIGITETDEDALTGNVFHHYIYPDNCSVESYAAEVNGYNLDFLTGKPNFGDIADELIAFIQGSELVSLVTEFDIGFLNVELNKVNKPSIASLCQKITDLRSIAKKIAPKGRSNLQSLVQKYGIEVNSCQNLPAKLQSTVTLYRLHQSMKRFCDI